METMRRTIVWLAKPGVMHAYTLPSRAAADKFAIVLSRMWPGFRVWIEAATEVGEMPTIGGSLEETRGDWRHG